MSRQIQIRRGTAAEHDNFIGAIGEITMDTTNKTLRVHDGVTVGGNKLMLANDEAKINVTNCITKIPENIKLELNSGVLTLKSGSKFCVPNGKSSVGYEENLGAHLWNAVIYDGTKFVALGNTGYLSTSTDGTTWAAAYKGTNIASKAWKSMTFAGIRYVALGLAGWITTSTDLISWTTPVQPLGAYQWRDLVCNGNKVIALSQTGYICVSTDNGFSWALPTQNANLGSNTWSCIIYDGTKYIALSETGYISTSTDGTTWNNATLVSNLGSHEWKKIVYNGNIYIAIGKQGYMSTSTDGVNWSEATYNSNIGIHEWMGISTNGQQFVIIGNSAYTGASADGINWGESFKIEITTQNDVTVNAQTTTGQTMVFYNNTTGTARCDILVDSCISGTSSYADTIYYNTDTNIIDYYDSSALGENSKYSFPLAIVTVSGGNVTSIDKIFNGFGYIGSIVFCMPGVKGLIPNGRKSDGSLNSTEFTVYDMLENNVSGTSYDLPLLLSGSSISFDSGFKYNESTNISSNNKVQIGCIDVVSGKITSFYTKPVYSCADYGDLKFNSIKNVANNRSQSGYYKLSNGLIIQWLQITDAIQNSSYSWPTSFTSGTSYIAVPTYNNQNESEVPIQIWEQTSTTVTLHRYGGLTGFNIGIIAIGY